MSWRRLEVQPLEETVEVVRGAGVVVVDEHFGVARCDLNPQRSAVEAAVG
jgi:hypothetical protein